LYVSSTWFESTLVLVCKCFVCIDTFSSTFFLQKKSAAAEKASKWLTLVVSKTLSLVFQAWKDYRHGVPSTKVCTQVRA
jgi:hypothetical protein